MNKKGQLDITGYSVGDLCSRLEKCMAEEKDRENSTTRGEELCLQMKMMGVSELNTSTVDPDKIPFISFNFI